MKRILSAAAAFSALALAPQAHAVDYCVGTTNGVDNMGSGFGGSPACDPFTPTVNQNVQNTATGGTFAVNGNIFAGIVTAHLGHSGIAAGSSLMDRFLFTLPQTGFGSGAITTTATALLNATDLDFLSVDINGIGAAISTFGNGQVEIAFADVPIFTGIQNILTINYLSRGAGSYGGDLTFVPVPEPTTWALMLAGFGAIGFSMRRRRKPQPKVRFAF